MRKRNCRAEVYFSKAELEELNRLVRKTRFSREGFIRHAVKNAVFHEAPPAEYYDLIAEVRTVGTLLRQLYEAAAFHSWAQTPELQAALEQNHATESMLWDAFFTKP